MHVKIKQIRQLADKVKDDVTFNVTCDVTFYISGRVVTKFDKR